MSRIKSRWFRPDYSFPHPSDVTPGFLAREGVSGLILDLDNTLTRWEDMDVAPGIEDWVQSLRASGVKLVMLSNGIRGKRIAISRILGIPLVCGAVPKPFAQGFRRALDKLGLPAAEVAIVGDIIFTDILGANRLGIKSILTEPLSPVDFLGTKVWRLLESVFRLRRPYQGDPP